jgi:hypothetical protein
MKPAVGLGLRKTAQILDWCGQLQDLGDTNWPLAKQSCGIAVAVNSFLSHSIHRMLCWYCRICTHSLCRYFCYRVQLKFAMFSDKACCTYKYKLFTGSGRETWRFTNLQLHNDYNYNDDKVKLSLGLIN